MEKLKNMKTEEKREKLKIVFVGIPDMAIVCLNELLENKFDIAGVVPPKRNHETYAFFKNYVKGLNLNFIEYENSPNDKDCIDKIKSLNADIGVVCSFNYLLKKDFINSTKMGYINCHPSLLPEYRGAAPYFHIINNGEKVSGITLHFIDEEFDKGDIVYQEVFDLTPYETMGTIFNRSNYMIADALVKVLNEIQSKGEIKRTPQPKENTFKQAPKVDGNFRVRWNVASVFEIERLIRACNPFYNAFGTFRGVNFKIINAHAVEYKHDMEFGRIFKANEKQLLIACKGGLLDVKTMHLGTWGYFGAEEFYYMFTPKDDEYLI